MRRTVLLTALLLASATPANAAWAPLTGGPAPIQLKTAHRMAERWANTGDPNQHSTRCRRKGPAITCRIVYYNVALPVDVWKNGRWVTTRGTAWETATIRRRRHRIVLTSDVFPGGLSQRG